MKKKLPLKPSNMPQLYSFWLHSKTGNRYKITDHVFDATAEEWAIEYVDAWTDEPESAAVRFTRLVSDWWSRFAFIAYDSAAYTRWVEQHEIRQAGEVSPVLHVLNLPESEREVIRKLDRSAYALAMRTVQDVEFLREEALRHASLAHQAKIDLRSQLSWAYQRVHAFTKRKQILDQVSERYGWTFQMGPYRG